MIDFAVPPPQAVSAEHQAVQQAIGCARADTSALAVVQLPPGAGKSTLARDEAVQLLLDGHLRRVLWAVRETRSVNSLGREALAEFKRLTAGTPIRCDLVLGREAASSAANHRRSRVWPIDPCIKIISHAHLPLMMDSGLGTSALVAADLLIIDEDPADSLIDHHIYHLDALTTHRAPGDRISECMVSMGVPSDIAACGTAYRTFDGRKGADIWHGDSFWETLHNQLGHVTVADVDAFITTLSACAASGSVPLRSQQLDLIRTAFVQDHVAPVPSPRFSLSWSGGIAALEVYVRLTWCLDLPVVVLDAYADAWKYSPLFREREVQVFGGDVQGKSPTFHSANQYLAALDTTNFRTGRQRELLRRILQEIRAYRRAQASPRPTLLVAHKEVLESTEFERLGREVFGSAWGTDVKVQHWHAGRGKNEFEGYDIFALTRPKLSKRFREFTMGALEPYDPDQRELLHQLEEQSEFLQTMQRNRQGKFPAHDRPINVLLWDHPGAQDYQPHLRHTKKSCKPDWRDQAAAVLTALRDRVGGVPHAALYVAGLLRPGADRDVKIPPELERGIQRVLSVAGTLPSLASMTESGARKALPALLEELGLVKVTIHLSGAGKGQATVMKYYVPSTEADPKAAAQAVAAELQRQGSVSSVTAQAQCLETDDSSAAATSGAYSSAAS